ncbi:hypothetical protein JTB14_036073 [Gonioctena quinquepunctata]|nr:hypothetical protein JTB14_036073 [Gonioctena quinquepunctata]
MVKFRLFILDLILRISPRMTVILLLLQLIFVSIDYVSSQNPSPCPDTFTYEPKGVDEDRWYGVIQLQSVDDLTGVWITIQLDRTAELLGNWFGETISSDNKEFRIVNHDYKLEAGPPVSVRFFVKYDRYKTIPSLQGIRLNGKTICSSQRDGSELGPTTPKLHISHPKTTKKPNTSGSNNRPISTTGSRPTSGSSINRDPVGITNVRPANRPSSSNSIGGNVNNRPIYKEPENDYDISPAVNGGRPTSRPSSVPNSGFNNNGQHGQPSINTQPSYNTNLGSFNSGSSNTGQPEYNQPSNNREPSTSSSNSNSGNGRIPSSVSLNNQDRYPDGSGDNSGVINRPNNNRPVGRPTGSNNAGPSEGNSGDDDSDYFPGDFANIQRPTQNKPSSRPQSSSGGAASGCGTVASRPSPLIANGQDTTPGQWPWHAALYHSKGIQLVYICGGTLISTQHVITAAHCVTKAHSSKVVESESILVYLGKYNLVTFGPEVQDRDVSDIFVHPQYNHSVYFNDIAILKLSSPVDITNFVRTCCVWDEATDLENIISRQGTVVGWGFDENKKLSNKLMQAEMPVVSTVTCIYSNRDFFSQFTFEKNYCAGFRNGTSVCNGDSGGGMVFPKRGSRGQSTVWQLRGVVSVGVALQGQGVCDTSQYIVFTDVAKHLSWIQRTLLK